MNIYAVEQELLHLQTLVARWTEQNYTPTIERDIALTALRKIYDELLCETPAEQCTAEKQCAEPTTQENAVYAAPTDESCDCDQPSEAEEELPIDQIAQVIDNIGEAHQEEPVEQELPEQPEEKQQEPQEQPEEEQYTFAEQTEIADQIEIEIEPIQEVQDIQEIEEYQQQPAQPEQCAQDNDEARCGRFIHDLFCNDETFYLAEMRKIEALTSLDDVLIYIGQKYAWTPDNETAEEFVTWISTRFND